MIEKESPVEIEESITRVQRALVPSVEPQEVNETCNIETKELLELKDTEV